MTRWVVCVFVLTNLGCTKQPDPLDAALKSDYDAALKSHKGHEALKWYSGTELCRIEGADRQKPTLLAIYFVRRVVDPHRAEPNSLAEAIIWRDETGKWFTGPWQKTAGGLTEIKMTSAYLKHGKPSATFKEALDLLVERKKEAIQ